MTPTMRAMQVHELGGPLRPTEGPLPVPGPGQVLLEVEACGINFADTLMVAGKYQEKPPMPFAPGLEVCGRVAALGEGAELPLGARVAALVGHGGLATHVLAPAAACAETPAGMAPEVAAGFLVAYGTSHLALEHRARMQPGETLLVLGAAGGVGLTAVEIGKLMGARVIACARGADRLEIARGKGADHLIDSDRDDIKETVRSLGGADVVYDPVGGAQFRAALSALNWEGRILPLGFASGEVPQIPANVVLVKNVSVLGLYWGAYARRAPEVLAASIRTLFGWWSEGRLAPHVSHVLPLERAAEALELLSSRTATGKVVVRMAAEA